MGTNRRYPDLARKLAREREAAEAMRDLEPLSLTPDELELDRRAMTRTPIPKPVSAWVRYGAIAIRVEAEAVAWTDRAVAVRWRTPDGAAHRAWVWNSAVDPR